MAAKLTLSRQPDINPRMSTAFAAYVADSLKSEQFTLIDVGCSGGIDPAWRVFGERLRAVAFDASLDECERLTREETNPSVRYVGGFVGLPPDHPFAIRQGSHPWFVRNPMQRTSCWRMLQIQKERLETASLEEKLRHNAWNMTKLADPNKPVIVPDVLKDLGWADVDLLKIDIDGPDFAVLNSFDGRFDDLGLLAARLEVNLYGGTAETEHAFHNTDRFMRARGFELLALDVRTYAMAALPSPFAITSPAQTVTGRPFQAEAFYARDPAGQDWRQFGENLSAEKMAKLAAIFSIWQQPDAAAELLLEYREKLAAGFDVQTGLELLAQQAQEQAEAPLSYAEYIAAFEADAPSFYPPPSDPPPPPPPPPRTLGRRLRAALQSFLNPDDAAFGRD